jgi:hypothetical protein
VAIDWHHLGRRRSRDYLGLIFIQGGVAAAAKIVTGTELNQQAAITTNDFSRIDWGKSGGHLRCGRARAGFSLTEQPNRFTEQRNRVNQTRYGSRPVA